MKITQFTDFSLRVLLYLGLKEEQATVAEIADAFRISRHHLVKIVHQLAQDGYVISRKGKGGGIEFAPAAAALRIGDFIEKTEPMDLLECFDRDHNTCPIQGYCHIERSLRDARRAFVDSLNRYTLGDFLKSGPGRSERLRRLGLGDKKIKAG